MNEVLFAHGRALHSFSLLMMKKVWERQIKNTKNLPYTRAAVFPSRKKTVSSSLESWAVEVRVKNVTLQAVQQKKKNLCFRKWCLLWAGKSYFNNRLWRMLFQSFEVYRVLEAVAEICIQKWFNFPSKWCVQMARTLNHIRTQCMNSHILDFPFQL